MVFPLLLSDFALALDANGWWLVLFVVLAAALSALVYRFTLPPATPLRKILLAGLRGVALAMIIFMLFEPVLAFLRERSERPSVLLLLDHSLSMSLSSGTESRESKVREFVASPGIDRLASRSNLRSFVFSDTLHEIRMDTLPRVKFDGIGSDISTAVNRAISLSGESPPVGIIVISDGAHNQGENPVRVAGKSPAPVYTFAVGDTTASADAVIAEILTNEVTYKGSSVPIDVRVQAKGMAGQSTRLRLRDPHGNVIEEQDLPIGSDEFERTISLKYVADTAGDVRLTAVLDTLRGESISDNNTRSVVIRVLENKSHVVLISGPPSPDLTVLRQTLEADSTLIVDSFVDLGGDKYLNRSTGPLDDDLRSADLLVLINYPARGGSTQDWGRVASAIKDRKIPVMFFAGPQLDATRLGDLAESLPITPNRSTPARERVVLRGSSNHAAVNGSTPLPLEWSDLPPVIGGIGNFSVSPSAQVVAKLSRELLGVPEDEPAVALWNSAGMRGVAVLCWNTSLWKLQMARNGTGAEFYSSLVTRLASWLIAPAEAKRVVIRSNKKLYSGGEIVTFQAQVYGMDLSPRDDAVVTLTVNSAGRSEVVPLKGRGSGRYEADFLPWANGDFSFRGMALAAGDTLGADAGLFAVEAFNIELVETQARYDILRQVASVSGGAFAPVEKAQSVLDSLDLSDRTVIQKREIPLWNQATMLWIIITLLAAEWMIRKRSGML